jgi:putative FmdB family regulatory protein
LPIYEYRCDDCTIVFERLVQGFSDAGSAPQSCPQCVGSQTRRLISRIALLTGGSVGLGRAAYPTSWQDTGGANPDALKYWRKRVEREQREETKHPELAGLRQATAERRWAATQPPAPPASTNATPKTASAPGPAAAAHKHPHSHPHPHVG